MSAFLFIAFLFVGFAQCDHLHNQPKVEQCMVAADTLKKHKIIVGAERLQDYLPHLIDKNVAGVFNQSSQIGGRHIVDVLLENDVNIKHIFTLEHGFRGDADAGEKVNNEFDAKTGLPLISIYGKSKKPASQHLEGIDVIIFDVQDVGVRFYTYISTLHYVMESAAEQNVELILLDRPNPNGHYVDGPVLDKDYQSFIGMHPVPVVHGMTIGEYAWMINGEKWLKDSVQCKLKVIPCQNYNKGDFYDLPVRPSPNLPNARSILLYPSLCFFEGTSLSIGRGTNKQFQVIGHPRLNQMGFSFIPESMPGARYPKHHGHVCYGIDLSNEDIHLLHFKEQLDLSYLLSMYKEVVATESEFFTRPEFFDKLAGSSELRKNILKGFNEAQIRDSWKDELIKFREVRSKYLLY
jgi:uncharacterized protein YbbC (DUF1343 family)